MMIRENMPFGEYIKQRREQLGKTLRAFAAEVEISPAYLCDIENGNRKPPERFLERLAGALEITDADELNRFYDLAGVSKNGQHSDINSYIDALPSARMALRTAKDNNFTDEDWLELIKIIKQKKT
jgi:transcriptional regulator with XRE-family HTH domain